MPYHKAKHPTYVYPFPLVKGQTFEENHPAKKLSQKHYNMPFALNQAKYNRNREYSDGI